MKKDKENVEEKKEKKIPLKFKQNKGGNIVYFKQDISITNIVEKNNK